MRQPAVARTRGVLVRLGRPQPSDVTSGAVTGLFSIPEGMAYASIAGFNPVAGLYAGAVPAIVGSLTSRTVLMVTTLTSAIALTSQSVLSQAGLDPKDAGNVAVLTVMVGAMMLLLGVLRLGAVMSFVSNAVMTGFSTGIALQIITGVLKDATGYRPQGHNKLHQLVDWLVHVGSWQGAATAVAASTVAIWAAARAVKRLEPVALLIAMVLAGTGAAVLAVDVELVQDIRLHPRGPAPLHRARPVRRAAHDRRGVLGGAGRPRTGHRDRPVDAEPGRHPPDVNGDFRSQGYTNLAGGLFQAMPSGGSL